MLEFKTGEVQYISAIVRPETTNEIAIINSASYKLIKYENEMVIKEGNCEIEGNVLRALIEFENEGFYKIEFTAKVGKETISRDATISVSR